LEVQWK